MKNEPGAELVEGPDEIWRKSNNTDAAADLALNEDFGDFGAPAQFHKTNRHRTHG